MVTRFTDVFHFPMHFHFNCAQISSLYYTLKEVETLRTTQPTRTKFSKTPNPTIL